MTASTEASGSGIASAKPVAGPLAADGGGQPLAQRRLRLDRDDVEPRRDERARELSGSRRQVQHGGARSDPELGGQRPHHRRRVLGAAAFIHVGDRGELLGEGVQRHAGRVVRGRRR